MAALTTAEFELNGVEGDIQLIMNGDDPLRGDIEKFSQRGYRTTAKVHVRLWFHQDEFGAAGAEAAFRNKRSGFMHPEIHLKTPSELIGHHETDIVPGMTVVGPGVTEPDYQPSVAHTMRTVKEAAG